MFGCSNIISWVTKASLVTAFTLLSVQPAMAGAGDIDLSFDLDGRVTTDIGGQFNDGGIIGRTDRFILSDGKIVVVAGSGAADHSAIYLVRFNANGVLDSSYGDGGALLLMKTDLPGQQKKIVDIEVAPDGTAYLAGNSRYLRSYNCTGGGSGSSCSDYYTNDYFLAKFNPDGRPDLTFGKDGQAVLDLSERYGITTNDYLQHIVILEDGSVLGVGESIIQLSDPFIFPKPKDRWTNIVRYTPQGELDLTFGVDGILEFSYTTGSALKTARGLFLQPDGKFLVKRVDSLPTTTYLVRYSATGTLDTSFGEGGLSLLPRGFDALEIQGDGSFLLAGSATLSTPVRTCGMSLFKLSKDGNLDIAFGTEGLALADFGCTAMPRTDSRAWKVYTKPDAAIVLSGEAAWYDESGRVTKSAFAQFDSNGNLDSSFGDSGRVIVDSNLGSLNIASLVTLANNEFLAFGTLVTYPIDDPYEIFLNPIVQRYTASGLLAETIHTYGAAAISVPWSSDDDAKEIIALQGDGKLLVGATSDLITNDDFVLVRYNADGSVDTSFGVNGKVSTDFTDSLDQPCDRKYFSKDELEAVAVQSDGKILAVGSVLHGNPYSGSPYAYCIPNRQVMAVARYHEDGTLDESFGIGGKAVFFAGSDRCAYANSVAVQDDGQILLAGSSCNGNQREYAVIRIDEFGSLDPTFGTNGSISIDPFNQPGFGYFMELSSVAIQPNGKIVVAGSFYVFFPLGYHHLDRWNLIRLNSDGSPDTTFNPQGEGIVNALFDPNPSCSDIALQSDGKILVTGTAQNFDLSVADSMTTLRFLQNGELDLQFGDIGKVQSSFGFTLGSYRDNSSAQSIELQEDGRIVVAGYANRWYESSLGIARNNDFALVRYNPDGTHDYSFGVAGLVTTDFGSNDDQGHAVTIQADGKIVVAGTSPQNYTGFGEQIAIARYEGVATRVDELEGLILYVQELNSSNVLNEGQTNALQVKLQGAIQTIDRGKYDTAANKLNAFINQVSAFTLDGIVAPDTAERLIRDAQEIIDILIR